MMEIIQAQLSDLNHIMPLYDQARQFMRQNGNQSQWIHGYPSRDLIAGDIQAGNCYVVLQEGELVGVFCFLCGKDVEPTYKVIQGAWLDDSPYGVLHRVASSGKVRRLVSACGDWALARCPSLRIDTHQDNRPMRQALERDGFQYCGIITIQDGSQRVAYQKLK